MRSLNVWLSGLCFSAAGAALVYGRGTLLVPGLVSVLVCICLLYLQRGLLAAVFGSVVATVSFSLQVYTGICPTCLVSAVCFALGSLAAFCGQQRVLVLAVVLLPLVPAGVLFMESQPAGGPAPQTVLAGQSRDSVPAAAEALTGKCLLYFSPVCGHCEETVGLFVERDPEGVKWVPVVVPYAGVGRGTAQLRELGYSGKVVVAAESPSRSLPCAVYAGEMAVGARAAARLADQLWQSG